MLPHPARTAVAFFVNSAAPAFNSTAFPPKAAASNKKAVAPA